nr:uncharacterized protein LOC109757865 isoform X9 [Aegilops tauschii subsp. strangulata]
MPFNEGAFNKSNVRVCMCCLHGVREAAHDEVADMVEVEVKTRCTSSSFVCFSVHLLPDARGRLAATTSHLFLSQRQQEKKGRFTSRCRPHHSHKETPASLPATRTSLTQPASKVVPRGHVPLQRHGLCFSGKQWSLLEESWGRGPPAQQYNFLFCGRSLKELSAGRSKKKHLSGFRWPSIIDMEMNNYADALLLFF